MPVQSQIDETPYVWRTSARSRSVSISISPKGEVVITTPPKFPQARAEQFLRNSQEWIDKHLALQRRRVRAVVDTKSMLYCGMSYEVQIHPHGSGNAVAIREQCIEVRPVEKTTVSVQRALVRWLKSEAEQYITLRAVELAKTMNVAYRGVQFRDQKTRWGSCSSMKSLQFNWRLIQAPKEVIDYVIMHELTHLKHMNHSSAFWAYVERFDPAYTGHKKWLRLHGAVLHQDFAFDPALFGVE